MATQIKPSHRHAWRFSSYTGPWARLTVTDRCRCGQERRRRATRREAKLLRERNAGSMRMFTVLHEFGRRFKNDDGSWKYRGHDLMQRIEQWAKRYPDRVYLAETDDSHHMSSFLCIIECATEDKWMGLTVHNIPQNGVELDEFFLYPCDHTPLVKLLMELKRKGNRIKKRERANKRKFWRAMHAACPKPRS